ncbi:unnamed protein product [Caenorhabditis nigoni]
MEDELSKNVIKARSSKSSRIPKTVSLQENAQDDVEDDITQPITSPEISPAISTPEQPSTDTTFDSPVNTKPVTRARAVKPTSNAVNVPAPPKTFLVNKAVSKKKDTANTLVLKKSPKSTKGQVLQRFRAQNKPPLPKFNYGKGTNRLVVRLW